MKKMLLEHRGMKINDIITTYSTGYHKLIRIEQSETNQILFYSKQVASQEGKLIKGNTEKCCDQHYCNPAIKGIESTTLFLENALKNIKNFENLLLTNKL